MPTRAPRSDAVANRDRIVDAARTHLDAADGVVDELSLHVVARTAGVGQATLYRHFPTREHLAAAVYERELDALVSAVPRLLAAHPPVEAFRRWLARLVSYARVKRGVVAAMEPSAWRRLYDAHSDRLVAAIDELLVAGRRTGELRADGVDAADVIMLLGALSRVPATDWNRRAPRIVAVLLDGLRRPDVRGDQANVSTRST